MKWHWILILALIPIAMAADNSPDILCWEMYTGTFCLNGTEIFQSTSVAGDFWADNLCYANGTNCQAGSTNVNPNISTMVNANVTLLQIIGQNNYTIAQIASGLGMVNNYTITQIASGLGMKINYTVTEIGTGLGMKNYTASDINGTCSMMVNANTTNWMNKSHTILVIMAGYGNFSYYRPYLANRTEINQSIHERIIGNTSNWLNKSVIDIKFTQQNNASQNDIARNISAAVNTNSTILGNLTLIHINNSIRNIVHNNNSVKITTPLSLNVANLTNLSNGGGMQTTGSINMTLGTVKYITFINGTSLETRRVS